MILINAKKEKGFTLIEALVAISILLIAIATPMSIAQKGLSDAEISKDEATASFLAEDAIEAVKNIRDNTALKAETDSTVTDWLSGLDDNCVSSYCNIDTRDLNVLAYNPQDPNSNPSQMEIARDTSGNFLYFVPLISNPPVGESPSIFSRYINIIPNPSSSNPNEAEVNVKVSWQSPGGSQSVIISDFIYNYSPYLQ